MAWKSRRGEGRVSFLYVYLRFYMMIHVLPKLYYILSFVQCLYSLYILSTKIVILDKSPFIMWAVYNGNLIFMMNYFPRQIWPAWHEITFGWRERSLNGEHLYCPLPLLNIYSIYTPPLTFGISVLSPIYVHTLFYSILCNSMVYWMMHDEGMKESAAIFYHK